MTRERVSFIFFLNFELFSSAQNGFILNIDIAWSRTDFISAEEETALLADESNDSNGNVEDLPSKETMNGEGKRSSRGEKELSLQKW